MLRRYIKINRSEPIISAAVIAGGFLLIELILSMFPWESSTAPMFAGLMLSIMGFIMFVGFGAAYAMKGVDLITVFGVTRRRALDLLGLMSGVNLAAASAAVWLLAALEKVVMPAIWNAQLHRNGPVLAESAELPWWTVPLILAAGYALGFVGGALVRRYGSWAGWTLWVLVILVSYHFDWLLDLLAPVALTAGLAAGVLLLAGLIWSIRYLLRDPVRT